MLKNLSRRQRSNKIRNPLIHFSLLFFSFPFAFIASQSDTLEEFQTSSEENKIKGSKENQIYSNIFLEYKNVIPILHCEYSYCTTVTTEFIPFLLK